MLTGALRDLHLSNPGKFITDVRTACGGLWVNNPYVTPLREDEHGVEVINCEYPLINESNNIPYHCLHGFRKFLAEKLGVPVRATAFKGDIHISTTEKSWYSQVYEKTGSKLPYWVIAAGGKYDITIKWWSHERYQAVVDHFRDKILFVQVGELGHHHPPLKGVLDLRGQTDLRELVRLVYHAQGVLCSVTGIMHLAAAVETKHGGLRPCVVVAGAREPAHWEAYPGHQFIHTNGSVECGGIGGCWKDRVVPLGDKTERDNPDHLCVDVVRGLPRCLHIITPRDVIRRIETYFKGGIHHYLSNEELIIKKSTLEKQVPNDYDFLPLTPAEARPAFHKFLKDFSGSPDCYSGRGIVICAGGEKYLACAWVSVRMLRHLGCELPIEIWHFEGEVEQRWKEAFLPYGVTFVNASERRKHHPIRILNGWELKPYAILHSEFQEVLFLDADNVPVLNPEFLFSSPEYLETGAIFWPDIGRLPKTEKVYEMLGLKEPRFPELESGQIIINKQKCLKALSATVWMNSQSDFFYQYLHGDKETFQICWRATKTPYYLVPHPVQKLEGTMCQHSFGGERLFQHRNTLKWDLHKHNKAVPGFAFQEECDTFLEELKNKWTKNSNSNQYELNAIQALTAA